MSYLTGSAKHMVGSMAKLKSILRDVVFAVRYHFLKEYKHSFFRIKETYRKPEIESDSAPFDQKAPFQIAHLCLLHGTANYDTIACFIFCVCIQFASAHYVLLSVTCLFVRIACAAWGRATFDECK